jgi:hypothetical protein
MAMSIFSRPIVLGSVGNNTSRGEAALRAVRRTPAAPVDDFFEADFGFLADT